MGKKTFGTGHILGRKMITRWKLKETGIKVRNGSACQSTVHWGRLRPVVATTMNIRILARRIQLCLFFFKTCLV